MLVAYSRVTCDHRDCHREILTPEDNEIVGNCNFHIRCWGLLSGDDEERAFLEFFEQEALGHA